MKQGIRETQVSKLFGEFWRLMNLNELYEIYPKISSGFRTGKKAKKEILLCVI
jgi:hypothetical protein